MHLQNVTRNGIVSLALAFASVGIWWILNQAQPWRPVYMGLNMSQRTFRTPEFRATSDATYRIKIVANTDRGLSHDTVSCLLGTSFKSNPCAQPSVVRANWALISEGRVVEEGSSEGFWFISESVPAEATLKRPIGNLDCKGGKSYIEEVTFLQDGSALAEADPHLIIEGFGDSWEGINLSEWVLLYLCAPLFVVYGFGALIYARVRYPKSK
jgi:hypothetical protein